MRPFLRGIDRPRIAPVGWIAEAIGVWSGDPCEIVYDPERHQIVLTQDEPDGLTRQILADQGFKCIRVEPPRAIWARALPNESGESIGERTVYGAERPVLRLLSSAQ